MIRTTIPSQSEDGAEKFHMSPLFLGKKSKALIYDPSQIKQLKSL